MHKLGEHKDIDVSTRLGVVSTHVLPKGEYGMGEYHDIAAGDLSRYSRSVVDVYRIVDGSQRMSSEAALAKGVKVSIDAEVVSRLKVMLPSLRLRYLRLRMLCQVISRGRTDILTLLVAGVRARKSWLRSVLADLDWVSRLVPKLSEMIASSPAQWFAFLQRHSKMFVQAVHEQLIVLSPATVVPVFVGSAPAMLALPQVPSSVFMPIELTSIWTCALCGKDESSYQAQSHMASYGRLGLAS